MGGEWASGAALVSETWPEKHRGKALGLMQSCWAIGYGAAAIVVAIVLPRTAGARCSSSASCPRSSRCGSAATSKSPRCGRTVERRPERATLRRAATSRAGPQRHSVDRRGVPDADERRDDVRVVGAEPLGAVVSLAAGRARRHRPHHRIHVDVHRRHAGRHVVRLRVVRLHQRCVRTQADLRHVSRRRGRAGRGRTARRGSRRCCSCSVRSWRFLEPDTSAASARSRRRSSRPRSAPPRSASPTTAAAC